MRHHWKEDDFLRKIVDSPGILGFEMEKNNIKPKISECVQNFLLYYLY